METRDQIKTRVQGEALAKVLPLRRAGVYLSMGVGKTLLGIKHMAENYTDYSKFLIVAPKISIHDEWIEQAKQYGYEYLIPHMHFTTYLSLPKQDLDYDVVYLDECHSLLFSHEEWLREHPGKILGLTGTPPRYERSEKGKMVSQFCPIVYEYEMEDAVGDKVLNDYKIIIHMLSLDPNKTMRVERKGKVWYTSELATYQYWSQRLDAAAHKKEQQIMSVMRMKSMMDFPSKEVLAAKIASQITDKHIIFANTQDQADRLCSHSYHSGNPDSEDNLILFKKGEINRLSAVLQLNEGVNIPNLREGIILHAYGNERKASQRIGRLLRLNPDDVATIHILCYRDTVDERWVKSALEDRDPSKISYQQW